MRKIYETSASAVQLDHYPPFCISRGLSIFLTLFLLNLSLQTQIKDHMWKQFRSNFFHLTDPCSFHFICPSCRCSGYVPPTFTNQFIIVLYWYSNLHYCFYDLFTTVIVCTEIIVMNVFRELITFGAGTSWPRLISFRNLMRSVASWSCMHAVLFRVKSEYSTSECPCAALRLYDFSQSVSRLLYSRSRARITRDVTHYSLKRCGLEIKGHGASRCIVGFVVNSLS